MGMGFVLVLFNLGDAPSFLLVYGAVAYFFSSKMVRLVLLLGPIASALGGVALGSAMIWSTSSLVSWLNPNNATLEPIATTARAVTESEKKKKKKKKKSTRVDTTA